METQTNPPRTYVMPLDAVTVVYDAKDTTDSQATTDQPLDDIFDVGTLILDERAGEDEGEDAHPLHARVNLSDEVLTDILARFMQFVHPNTDLTLAINGLELTEADRTTMIANFLSTEA